MPSFNFYGLAVSSLFLLSRLDSFLSGEFKYHVRLWSRSAPLLSCPPAVLPQYGAPFSDHPLLEEDRLVPLGPLSIFLVLAGGSLIACY